MRSIRCIPIVVLAITAMSCSTDEVNPAAPLGPEVPGPGSSSIVDPVPIVVSTSAELEDALTPANAGRLIQIRAGLYNLTEPLDVPDGVTLEGEGVMQLDDARLPTGFEAGTRTTLRMTVNIPGDLLTLGSGVTVRKLAIEDLAGRAGNAIGIVSRNAGDSLHATLDENEISNPNAHTIVPAGPAGCGVAIVTQNPNLGSAPSPHDGSAMSVRITRSLIRSATTGIGCGVFAFNFASLSSVSVAMTGNVVGGGLIASGGVSRPDAVHNSVASIQSQRNLYLNESPNFCLPTRSGWNLQGGSGTPVPFVIGTTERNSLRIHSQDDRIHGFTTAVLATAGRRFFGLPTAGPSSHNQIDMEVVGTTVSTPSCGGGTLVADFRLAGALVSNASLAPGDGNTLRAVIRGVRGSGVRSNLYADVLGPTGPVAPAFQGTGNRLEIAGSLRAFEQTNTAVEPAPAAEFFTSGN